MAASSSSLDRRRINGPETFSVVRSRNVDDQSVVRTTTKERTHVHPLFIQTGLVSQASGSAYLEGQTAKVACAVYGPRQASQQGLGGGGGGSSATATGAGGGHSYTHEAELNVDVRFASFATQRRKRPGKDTESNSLASAVRLALLPSIRLDKLPKASIDVYITILEANAGRGGLGGGGGGGGGGGRDSDEETCAASAVTAASCALADAGVEMYALVVGTHGVYLDGNESSLLVDATLDEAKKARASLTLYSMPALGTITSIEQSGRMTLDEMEKMMDVLRNASTDVHLTAAKAVADGFRTRRIGNGIV